MPQKSTTSSALALAVLTALGAASVSAQTVDPTVVLLQRLKQTAAAKTSDGYNLTAVKIKGDLATDGIKFTLPSVVPEKPLVLMQQRIANCNDRDVTGRSTVNKSTENSESFSKATQLGGETAVSVSYESPIGLSGSASQSFNYSTTSTEEKTYTETILWDQGIDVPVGPRASVTVQFVVAEQKMDNIPWSTNVIVGGPVELSYEKPTSNVTACLYQHANYGGKKKCWTTSGKFSVPNFKDVKWDDGSGNMNDEVTALRITGGAAKVTVYQDTNHRGWSEEYTSSVGNVGKSRNDKISSLLIDPQGASKTVTENVQKYLNDQQRRIALSGKYKGVNGVSGDFRTSFPTPLSNTDCNIPASQQQAAAGGSSTDAIRKAAAPSAMKAAPQAATVQSVAVAPNATPIVGGKILASGIKPTSKQVTKTSVKKT